MQTGEGEVFYRPDVGREPHLLWVVGFTATSSSFSHFILLLLNEEASPFIKSCYSRTCDLSRSFTKIVGLAVQWANKSTQTGLGE